MKDLEIKPGIYWVGGVDWDLRNFHGYLTQRGSTYNAYLIVDEKIVLVDTVKKHLFDDMLARIRSIVHPSKIDMIVSNHVEMDHSGSIPMMMELAPNAKLVTSQRGKDGLERHFKCGWDPQVVASGEEMSIGKRTLQFFQTPMVHWPDNMVTYVQEEKLLLSNDAFGQHIASSARFDDEIGWAILKEEAGKYFANIVLPYATQAKKALEALGGLDIDMIAPSHGIIWRSHIPEILGEYTKWVDHRTQNKAIIVFDSMWGSTEKIARKLREGMLDAGIHCELRNLNTTHISDITTDVLFSRAILIGSPTLNNGMLPTMGCFLTYIKGLRPKKRVSLAFGSYGWGGQAVGEIEAILKDMDWDLPQGNIRLKYIPDDDELTSVRNTGKEFGEYLKETAPDDLDPEGPHC